jgi:hypothetical protein
VGSVEGENALAEDILKWIRSSLWIHEAVTVPQFVCLSWWNIVILLAGELRSALNGKMTSEGTNKSRDSQWALFLSIYRVV